MYNIDTNQEKESVMANNFTNNFNPAVAQRRAYETKYANARVNLLLVVAFTAINIIILATGSYTYFLFSASIPYFIADMGMLLCGKYPPEAYVDGFEEMIVFEPSVFPVFLVIALLIVSVYLVFWFFSKKKPGFLMAALVLFVIDTVGMFILYGVSFDSIVDIIFHAYVIWSLVSGIKAHNALLALPKEEVAPIEGEGFVNVDPTVAPTEEAAPEVTEEVPAEEVLAEETPKEEITE